jgi:hypothetical protein
MWPSLNPGVLQLLEPSLLKCHQYNLVPRNEHKNGSYKLQAVLSKQCFNQSIAVCFVYFLGVHVTDVGYARRNVIGIHCYMMLMMKQKWQLLKKVSFPSDNKFY